MSSHQASRPRSGRRCSPTERPCNGPAFAAHSRLFSLLVLAVALVAAGGRASLAATLYHIHARIVAVDAAHRELQIHHDAFPAMPMAMTMICTVKSRAEIAKLHPGEIVSAVVDTSVSPWVLSQIHVLKPARR